VEIVFALCVFFSLGCEEDRFCWFVCRSHERILLKGVS